MIVNMFYRLPTAVFPFIVEVLIVLFELLLYAQTSNVLTYKNV